MLLPALLSLSIAQAAGLHMIEAEAIYGLAEPAVDGGPLPVEAGFGLSMASDGFAYQMTFGDPDPPGNGQGKRVKEWWFNRNFYGMPLMKGAVPFVDDESLTEGRPWLLSDSFGHLGGDATTRRNFEWQTSNHLGLSLPGFFGVAPQRLHLGPTAGFGLQLTWWELWKNHDQSTVATGKVTGEAGVVAGAHWREALYLQGRGTLHYDLFGIHQRHLHATAVAGVFLGAISEQRWGLEVRGEADSGNDTVTTRKDERFTVQGVLFVKGRAPNDGPVDEPGDLDDVLEQLRRSGEETPL